MIAEPGGTQGYGPAREDEQVHTHEDMGPMRCCGRGSGAVKGFSALALELKGTDGFPPGSELRAFVDSKDPSGLMQGGT